MHRHAHLCLVRGCSNALITELNSNRRLPLRTSQAPKLSAGKQARLRTKQALLSTLLEREGPACTHT